MKMTFLGDIMCEPPVLKAAKRRGGKYDFRSVFAPIKALLSESDYVVGNLETPLAGKEATWSQDHFCFNSPDEYADALIDAGIDLVNTANNHTFDRGFEGMERTIRVLDEKGLPHTGTYTREEAKNRPEAYYVELDGTKIAIICYTYGTNWSGSGKKCSAEGEYEGTCNLLRPQPCSSYLPGALRKNTKFHKNLMKLPFIKDSATVGKLEQIFCGFHNYQRHDDKVEPESNAPYLAKMKEDVRIAKEKADLVLFYPHVGGQFNEKPGDFSRYVGKAALEAGVDAFIATHSHIPQKCEWLEAKDGKVPVSWCLGNFNMNPKSFLAMPDILTNYGYALHLYIEDKKIQKVTFSMLKNEVLPDGQIASVPVDELYASLKSKKKKDALLRDIRHLHSRVTGQPIKEPLVRREYDIPQK